MVLALGILVWGIVSVMDAEPVWRWIIGVVITKLILPSLVIYRLLKSRRKLVNKYHRRNRKLEETIDQSRTSSDEWK